jgi:hypothetical protein
MKKRIRAWLKHRGISRERIRGRFFYNKGVPLAAAGVAEAVAFVAAIKERVGADVELIVVDTMARSMSGLRENDSGDVTKFNDMLSALREGFGDSCASLTLAHASNKEETTKKRTRPDFRGSSAASANFDAVYTLDRCKDGLTVELAPRWLKDHDEDDRPTIYFRLLKMPEFKSAVLERAGRPAKHSDTADMHQDLKTVLTQLGLDKQKNRVMRTTELATHMAECPPASFGLGTNRAAPGSDEHAVRIEKIGQALRNGIKESRKQIFAGLAYRGLHPNNKAMAATLSRFQPGAPKAKVELLWCLNAGAGEGAA